MLRFGAVQAAIQDDPGLHFKLPLIDNVLYFDKRVLDLDLPVQTLSVRRPTEPGSRCLHALPHHRSV